MNQGFPVDRSKFVDRLGAGFAESRLACRLSIGLRRGIQVSLQALHQNASRNLRRFVVLAPDFHFVKPDPLGRKLPITFVILSQLSLAVSGMVLTSDFMTTTGMYTRNAQGNLRGSLITSPTSTRIQGVYSFIHSRGLQFIGKSKKES